VAVFNNNQNNSPKATTRGHTLISKGMEVTGDFKGHGTVKVEGILNGNITVKSSVIISESGTVNGIINANNVTISGTLKGSIHCESLDIMINGSVSSKVEVKNLKVTGEVQGDITVHNLLNVTPTGYVHGEITLNKIIIDEGGRVIGSVQEFKKAEAIQETKPQINQEAKKSLEPIKEEKKF